MSITAHLVRLIYSAVFYALIPFICCRLLWRGVKSPAYLQRWSERFGIYSTADHQCTLWFHAVSVGEAEALFPLVKRIQQQQPHAKIIITTTTPTGSARVKVVLKETVEHVYLPYDTPDIVRRFMKHFKPVLAVIMETEIWPNLFSYCHKHHIPLYIINARLSEKSAQGYQKISALIKPTLARAIVLSQSQQDTERFVRIGVPAKNIQTLGNIKFDVDLTEYHSEQGLTLKAQLFRQRFVWLIASTHPGEEAIFLSLYPVLKAKIPALLLVFVPRHPERFLEVEKLCEQHLQVVKRTHHAKVISETDVYLLDTMGELKTFYATADVAFVGGSMVPIGGHNILEAAAVGVPVMFGPFMANFKAITDSILQAKAAIQCQNKQEIVQTIMHLHENFSYRTQLSERSKAFVNDNKGVGLKIYTILAQHITPASSF